MVAFYQSNCLDLLIILVAQIELIFFFSCDALFYLPSPNFVGQATLTLRYSLDFAASMSPHLYSL